MRRSREFKIGMAFLSLAVALGIGSACMSDQPGSTAMAGDGDVPLFEVDPMWPNPLPNHWVTGSTIGVGVDSRDHIWVIHREGTLGPNETGGVGDPPRYECCVPAPPVLEFDPDGNLVGSWGGPGEGYTWYDAEHGIYIDHYGFVWTGTSNGFHVMKFTQDGKHVLTIGEPGINKGRDAPDHLGGPANFYVEPKTNEIFIADGYRNKRVVVYDAETGKYLRHWGAYGKPPDDTYEYEYPVNMDDLPQQYSTLHGIVGTKDGLIYVADRRGNRIQVFRQTGEYLMERVVRPETGGSGSSFSLQLSRDPEQSILYLMDGTNQRVWLLRREDLKILDRFGKTGRQSGEFIRAHMISIDSKNRMYTGEAGNGRRMQRWILKGTKPAASVKPPAG